MNVRGVHWVLARRRDVWVGEDLPLVNAAAPGTTGRGISVRLALPPSGWYQLITVVPTCGDLSTVPRAMWRFGT